MRTFISLILALSTGTATAQSSLRVAVHASESANYLYQLDCVAGVIFACARDDYSALWRTEFLKTAADSAALNQWRSLRLRYSTYVPIDSTGRNRRGLDLAEKLRIAGLQSNSMDDFLTRLDLVVLPEDRNAWSSASNYFWSAFDEWWKRAAAAPTAQFGAATEKLLARDDIQRQLNRFVQFYRAELPPSDTATLTLFYRPDMAKSQTSGQQIGNYSVVEFLPNETPERRMSVVLHELCHYLFHQAPATEYDALRDRFNAVGGPAANAAYNLLNEGLASIFGNGIIEHALRTPASWERYMGVPGSFYNNPSIDKLAKGLYAWMDSVMDRNGTLYDKSFIPEYVSRTATLFGDEIGAPRLQLSEAWFFVDEAVGGFGPLRNVARSELGIASMYGSSSPMKGFTTETLQSLPGLPALLVVGRTALPVLQKQRLIDEKTLAILIKGLSKGDVVWSGMQANRSPLYIIVVRDPAGAERQLRKLATIRKLTSGLVTD